jgi:hypothetical protein
MDTQSLGVTRGIVTSKSGARNCLAGASRNGNVPGTKYGTGHIALSAA